VSDKIVFPRTKKGGRPPRAQQQRLHNNYSVKLSEEQDVVLRRLRTALGKPDPVSPGVAFRWLLGHADALLAKRGGEP